MCNDSNGMVACQVGVFQASMGGVDYQSVHKPSTIGIVNYFPKILAISGVFPVYYWWREDTMSNQIADPEVDGILTPGLMTDAKQVLAFMLSGNATLTFKGKTCRYTYKISKGDEPTDEQKAKGWSQAWFVALLTGSDNESDYTYMGIIRTDRRTGILSFYTAGRTRYNMQSPNVVAFTWAFNIMLQGRMPVGMEVWHEGRCGRCGRKLTDDVSIKNGFGPTCIELMGGMAAVLATTYAAPAPTVVHSITPINGNMDAMKQTYPPADNRPVFSSFTPRPAVRPTPAQIVAEVDAAMASKKIGFSTQQPVKNTPAAVKFVVAVATGDAEALAASQGWTVAEATEALSKRKTVNLNATKAPSKAEEAIAEAMIAGVKTEPLVDEAYNF